MQWSYPELRRRMIEAELWPQGRMARLACYLAGMAGVLYALQKLLHLFAAAWGQYLVGWVDFLIFIAAVLFSILAFRWLRRRILWRLRNRLIVTYVFIGVIPVVLLVAMAAFSLFLFAGQFATFVVISELNSQLRSAAAVNAAIGNEIAAGLERSKNPSAESLAGLKKRDRAWGRRHVRAWQGAKALSLPSDVPSASLDYPAFLDSGDNEFASMIRAGKPFREIVRDHGKLYLRVVSVLNIGSQNLTVVTSEPLDRDLVSKVAESLGEITLSPRPTRRPSRKTLPGTLSRHPKRRFRCRRTATVSS